MGSYCDAKNQKIPNRGISNPCSLVSYEIIVYTFKEESYIFKYNRKTYINLHAITSHIPLASSLALQRRLNEGLKNFYGLTIQMIICSLNFFRFMQHLKLDGLGPVDNRPSTNWPHYFE